MRNQISSHTPAPQQDYRRYASTICELAVKGSNTRRISFAIRVLYPARKRAGVPRVSWHELRHTHATLLNAHGESMKTIEAQLRHSSFRVTMDTYTHAIPQHQRDAVE